MTQSISRGPLREGLLQAVHTRLLCSVFFDPCRKPRSLLYQFRVLFFFVSFFSLFFRVPYFSALFLLSGGSLACDDVDMLEILPVTTVCLDVMLTHYKSTDTITTITTSAVHCHVQVPAMRCLKTN
jgi:hypothetical protein